MLRLQCVSSLSSVLRCPSWSAVEWRMLTASPMTTALSPLHVSFSALPLPPEPSSTSGHTFDNFYGAFCFTSELLNTTNFICALNSDLLYRKLPELTAEDFSKIDVSQYSWIHFEASFLKPAKRHHYQTAFTHRAEVLKVTAG